MKVKLLQCLMRVSRKGMICLLKSIKEPISRKILHISFEKTKKALTDKNLDSFLQKTNLKTREFSNYFSNSSI